MSEDFMEWLFTHELNAEEYGQIIYHCLQQLDRLGYYIGKDLEDWKPENKIPRVKLVDLDKKPVKKPIWRTL